MTINPAVNASPPREPRHEVAPPDPADVARLITHADDPNAPLGCFLRLAATSGARRGELCALRWKHVDFDKPVLIERSIVENGKGELIEKDTKTHAARQLRLDAGRSTACGGTGPNVRATGPSSEGSCTPRTSCSRTILRAGRPGAPGCVTLAFCRLRDDLEMSGVRLHDLRHFAATILLSSGKDVKTVSGRLGHANAATTLGVYAHFVEAADAGRGRAPRHDSRCGVERSGIQRALRSRSVARVKGILNTAVPRGRLLCAENGAEAIEKRRARLLEPHIAPLTKWVATVRDRLDPCHAKTVCDFDPDGGGTEARVMYLAQDPSSTAADTGFISPDNNDLSAKATTEACLEAGLAARERVHWNVFPWWLEAPCHGRVPKEADLAHVFLIELLERLDEVASVVLIGGKALKAWKRLFPTGPPHADFYVGHGPHPSFGWWSKPYGQGGRLGREVVVDELRAARAHALKVHPDQD